MTGKACCTIFRMREDSKVFIQCKNAKFILFKMKGDPKGLKNYRPVSVLAVVYKLVTKVCKAAYVAVWIPINADSRADVGNRTQP